MKKEQKAIWVVETPTGGRHPFVVKDQAINFALRFRDYEIVEYLPKKGKRK